MDLLRKAGAQIEDGNLVYVSSGLVEKALATVPKRIALCNRHGKAVTALEGNRCYYGPGSDTLNIIGHRTGERRTPRLQDVVEGTILCDALPNVDFIEVALTELAAERATPADTKQIRQALRAMEDAAQDEQNFVEADLEFHLAVARAGRNQLLEQFYHLSRKLLAEVIAGCVRLPGVKEESIRIQGIIVQAIEEKEPHLAKKAALDHMAYIERLLET
jgi:hypothetical protein